MICFRRVYYLGFIMNRYVLSITFFVSFFSALYSMEPENFEFRLATSDDLNSLVCLMNEEGCQEEGIVIPPEKFRAVYFQNAIDNKELFVIAKDEEVIGYKKLFLMDEEAKRNSILEDEIRCKGAQSELLNKGTFFYDGVNEVQFVEFSEQQPSFKNQVYIYNGGDFTKKAFRRRGLNKALMLVALRAVKPKTEDYIAKHKCDAVSLVYGITGGNGAFSPGLSSDRTRPITRAFLPYAREIATGFDKESSQIFCVLHERYKAFKPSFDPEDNEFKPLSDEFSIPGAGVVLSFPIKHEDGK